jgi:hypothetical protein
LSKNTYFFKNSVNTKYKYDFNTTLPSIKPTTKNFVNVDIIKDPAISSYPLVAMSLFYIFFSDEPLIANFSPPTFHKPEYTKYGTCIPGEFDIGQWFRPFAMEIQLWEKDGTIEFKDGEPLFYVKFNTNKQINLKRFVFTEQLSKYSNHCTTYKNTFGHYHKFNQLYSKFNQSRIKPRKNSNAHNQSDGLSDSLVDEPCKSPNGSGPTNLSPIHFCPHQHNPSALIKQVPVPQQRWSSLITKLLLILKQNFYKYIKS